jgi:hypothetical protein
MGQIPGFFLTQYKINIVCGGNDREILVYDRGAYLQRVGWIQ